jgi:hypothetical protein
MASTEGLVGATGKVANFGAAIADADHDMLHAKRIEISTPDFFLTGTPAFNESKIRRG